MTNPYANLPDHHFWKRSVALAQPDDIDPLTHVPFVIGPKDPVVTAGSCFAQHISRTLVAQGFNYLVAESTRNRPGAEPDAEDIFSARYGNVYTVRQLCQLFDRAYGLFANRVTVWQRGDGRYIDAYRPNIEPAGFASADEVIEDGLAHLKAVRRVFEKCAVFVFTLGLTEGWVSQTDGAVYPLAPGVVAKDGEGEDVAFRNFDVASMVEDFNRFLTQFRHVNPHARIIVTVSPVPLIATYETRHVLVSNTYSKAALRVVAEQICNGNDVVYFPSYEIITGAASRYSYYESDLRSVTKEGVAHVMRVFSRHFLSDSGPRPSEARTSPAPRAPSGEPDIQALHAIMQVVCDEEAIDATP